MAQAVNLLYFYEGGGTSRGLYDYDTEMETSTFRTSVAGAAGGNPRLLCLDSRPTDGAIFGIDAGANRLIRLDPNSGRFLEIGGPGGSGIYLSDLSFHPDTSVLFGLQFEAGTERRTLITINTSNGAVTEIGDLGFVGTGATALEFLEDGTLLVFESVTYSTGRLLEVDPANADWWFIGYTGWINTVTDMAAVGNQLFAVSFGYGETFLWEIDAATGASTRLNSPSVGVGYGGVVAYPPAPAASPPVPSLSSFSQIVFAACLLMLGWISLRK
jgi:hypothetical protein